MDNTQTKKWWALVILCFGVLMIVLDTTIVNIALPSIRVDLGFTESSLVWVVNAYLLTFGGFLLLSGRLGDLFGHRRLFLVGIAFFTLASLVCGIAHTQWILITARAVQGLAGAIVAAVALSLIMNLFTETKERAKAMGVYSFVAASGGSIGLLLGGVLTNSYDWHWNFLVNIPIGIAVFILSLILVPSAKKELEHRHIDVWGAITVTLALMLAVYAIVNGNQVGWLSAQTLTTFALAIIFLIIFLVVESRTRAPLVPLNLFRLRNLTIANTMAILWAAGMFTIFFLSALYLQLVLHYNSLQVGLAFLPGNIIMAAFSLGLSARLVMKFGIRKPLIFGLGLAALSLLYLSRAPIDANYLKDIFPSMLLIGFGAGMAFNPMLLAAMGDVPQSESGLASGLVNTAFMMGGALGLAILASLAAYKTMKVLGGGVDQITALLSGYHFAFLVGGLIIAAAALLGFYLRPSKADPAAAPQMH